MKYTFRVILLGFFIMLFWQCKKYDEGGNVFRSKYRLLGSNNDGGRKSWKLRLYQVNGIDSTYLIKGPQNWPTFYSEFAIFYRSSNDNKYFQTSTYLYEYHTRFDSIKSKKYLTFGDMNYYKTYNNQFGVLNGDTIYCRNLFCPEALVGPRIWYHKWQVKKLTNNELIIEMKRNNEYRIELVH